METPNYSSWSELPMDILRSLLERLSFADFQRAKMVCSNWYFCSKQPLLLKSGPPWLILFSEDGCMLYSPDEDRVYKRKRDFSGIRFLANSEDLRGVLRVDEKEEYIVVWCFDTASYNSTYVGFCKNGEIHYREIPTHGKFQSISDMVLWGDRLYMFINHSYPRIVDLSGKDCLKDVVPRNLPILLALERGLTHFTKSIAVTTSGEVLLVHNKIYKLNKHRIFTLYKMDPTPDDTFNLVKLVKVDSLGDDALFLDSGITVPANKTLGIEPNSIYFTRDERVISKDPRYLDICVYNLATKTLKRFPRLSELHINDALWFLPS
ncbi:hypothetical protein AALP_AA8G428200 [Arabis alpina]|uniref:F-box domain-containing protein n=1 Tax=Arabis alpina TaxID=50452 RepID=A0A087GD29_ARAAL|nr:hypothetical protein AALP_AA8G428200 [Arabis alpina]